METSFSTDWTEKGAGVIFIEENGGGAGLRLRKPRAVGRKRCAAVDIGIEFREPVEVYEAAMGNRQPLADRLRSKAPLGKIEREALACLIEGRLKGPPGRKPGRGSGKPRYLHTGVEYLQAMMLPFAEARFQEIKQRMEAEGVFHGNAGELEDYIAKEYLTHPEASDDEKEEVRERFAQYRRWTKKYKESRMPRPPADAVEGFHHWLYMQGRTEWLKFSKTD